jgi:hypothetical protein
MNHMNRLGKKNISISHKRYEDMNHMNWLGKNVSIEKISYEEMNHMNGLEK